MCIKLVKESRAHGNKYALVEVAKQEPGGNDEG
jgi:hypothetical protein